MIRRRQTRANRFETVSKAAAFGVLALTAAGCGGSSHSTSQTVLSEPTASPPTTTTAAAPKHRTKTTPRVTTAPTPSPPGTPRAPDGLRQTTGYATYELCSGRCSGAVPASLRRSLHLPSSCTPRAGGPVTPQPSGSLRLMQFVASSWEGARVTWGANGYRGPVLIRGRQIGGPHAVGFGEGHVPYDELQLLTGSGGPPWPSITRVRGPGCYAYQVDGTSFSNVIVFRAS